MRLRIEIDDDLMREALCVTGLTTEREVIELGLRTLVQMRAQQDIRALRGKVAWTGDLDAMRED